MEVVVERVTCTPAGLWTLAGRVVQMDHEIAYAVSAKSGSESHGFILADDHSFSYQGPLVDPHAPLHIQVDYVLRCPDLWHPHTWTSTGLVLQRGDDGRISISISGNAGLVRLGNEVLQGGNLTIDGNRGLIGGRAAAAGPANVSCPISGTSKPLLQAGGIALGLDDAPTINLLAWPFQAGNAQPLPIILGRDGRHLGPQKFFRAIYGPCARRMNGQRDRNDQRSGNVSGQHAELALGGPTGLTLACCSTHNDIVIADDHGQQLRLGPGSSPSALPAQAHLELGNEAGRVRVRLETLPMPDGRLAAVSLALADPQGLNRIACHSLFLTGMVALEISQGHLHPRAWTSSPDSLCALREAHGHLVLGGGGLSLHGHCLDAPLLPAPGLHLVWTQAGVPVGATCQPPQLTPPGSPRKTQP